MARERGQRRSREEATDEGGDTEEVRWERGSGGVEPRGDAAPRPRAPTSEQESSREVPEEYETGRRGPERAPTAGAKSGRRRRVRGEDVQSRSSSDANGAGDRQSRSGGDADQTRRYGATGRRASSGRTDERTGARGRRDQSGDEPAAQRGERGEQAAHTAGSREGQRVGWPGNRRSGVGDADTGSSRGGSQRGSERETGIAGRTGGHFGEDRSGDAGGASGRDDPEQFGGERGGDVSDRRYGSRRGHGSQRREDPRTE